MTTEQPHPSITRKCAECKSLAAHRLTDDVTGEVIVLCCACFTLLLCGSYKPGRCGDGITLEELMQNAVPK